MENLINQASVKRTGKRTYCAMNKEVNEKHDRNND
jgi:hypothetical protein